MRNGGRDGLIAKLIVLRDKAKDGKLGLTCNQVTVLCELVNDVAIERGRISEFWINSDHIATKHNLHSRASVTSAMNALVRKRIIRKVGLESKAYGRYQQKRMLYSWHGFIDELIGELEMQQEKRMSSADKVREFLSDGNEYTAAQVAQGAGVHANTISLLLKGELKGEVNARHEGKFVYLSLGAQEEPCQSDTDSELLQRVEFLEEQMGKLLDKIDRATQQIPPSLTADIGRIIRDNEQMTTEIERLNNLTTSLNERLSRTEIQSSPVPNFVPPQPPVFDDRAEKIRLKDLFAEQEERTKPGSAASIQRMNWPQLTGVVGFHRFVRQNSPYADQLIGEYVKRPDPVTN